MGYCYATGKYYSYGIVLPEDFDMTQPHTYLLKNRVNADGTNMVYLYVDKTENGVWTEVGPLNYNIDGSEVTGTGLSGMDFNFKYIGAHDQYGFKDQVVSYFEIHQVTDYSTYKWEAEPTEFANLDITIDGNRIDFPKEDSGVITDGEGQFTLTEGRLKFETSDFMDRAYSTYVAMTVHDKDHTPTPLNQSDINVSREAQMFKKLSVIPANVVYYEDDFPAIHYVGGNDNVFTPMGTGTLDKLQSADQGTEYGSDVFYQNTPSDMSGDHITQITIRKDAGALAWFEFTGTGFELASRTTETNAAMIYVQVYNKTDVTVSGNNVTANSGVKALASMPLFTEFDNQSTAGEVIHQVPVIRWQREDDTQTSVDETLTPGEYVVIINGYATLDFSNGYDPENATVIDTYLYIDGVRIFQPMGFENPNYNDLENGVIFDEIRDHVVNGKIMVCEKTDAGVIMNSGTVTWTENHIGEDHTGEAFVGNEVNSVNDYLLFGPNNEVYMDGSSGRSSIAFVIYRNADEAYKDGEQGLQIAVRAIDAGSFYGNAASGMMAKLQLGVLDANGTNSWTDLATVSSGTEQYVSIPYELCPVTRNNDTLEYHVIIRVAAAAENTPAMVSFSSLKIGTGLELKSGIGDALTITKNDNNGLWVTTEGEVQDVSTFLMVRRALASNAVISYNEAVPGENFVTDTDIPENVPAILPKYPSLSFEGEIQYNVYYTLQNLADVAPEDMGLITFDAENVNGTISEAMDVIPGALFTGSQYVVHTNGIPAKNLGDTLYFKVYAKLADGSYLYSDMYNYSAKMYAENKLAGSDDSLKALVVAMLNYGAEAQKFFGYNTHALMNADLTAEQQALVPGYYSGMATEVVPADSSKVGVFVDNGGFSKRYPSVTFGGAFAINYYFTPSYAPDADMTLLYWDAETYNSVDVLTAENASGSKKMTAAAGSAAYCAAYEGIAAKEINDTVYVAVVYESDGVSYCSGILAYSLGKYCESFAENTASSEQDLAAATMVYGYYAEKYFVQ